MHTAATIVLDFIRDRDALITESLTANPSDYVVVFDAGASLFGAQLEIDGTRVTGLRGFAGLRAATKMRRDHAERITAGDNIRNAAGDVARPMPYAEALKVQAEKLADCIAVLLED